jgi:hypothetical protein
MRHFLKLSPQSSVLSPLLLVLLVLCAACGAAAVPLVPTDVPTPTETFTPSPTRTPGRDSTPTARPTQAATSGTSGETSTPLFGPTHTAQAANLIATRDLNPNAPRIEFFTADVLSVAPGATFTLFWSTRNVSAATIYRLDRDGSRTQVWNVPADGSLAVNTRRSDREVVDFVLSITDENDQIEETLSLPLSCPDAWFFEPGPEACPQSAAMETRVIEQQFERGRMIYVEGTQRVYVLFNDGLEPAWVEFENRYDPATDPESESSYVPPPGMVQPIRQLGFLWRGSDAVRNRLGNGLAPESIYDGFAQSSGTTDSTENVYLSSADGSVLQLVPGGETWQIITPPSS